MSTAKKRKSGIGVRDAVLGTSAPPLIEAAEKGDVERIKDLIKAGADVDEMSDPKSRYYGRIALIIASGHGHLEAVQTLLEHGARLTWPSADGSALAEAISGGHARVVRLLLKHGARQIGFSLFNALNQNNVAVFQAVAEAGISFDSFRERLTKRSLLEDALHTRKQDVASFLLEHGVKLHGDELIECAGRGNALLVSRLIERGADPNKPSRKGRLPLSAAAYWANKEVAKVLIEHGAALTVTDLRGWSSVDWARYGKRQEMAAWLDSVARKKGVKIPKQKVVKGPEF